MTEFKLKNKLLRFAALTIEVVLPVLRALIAVIIGLSMGGALAWFAGENPVHVIEVILKG